MTKNALFSALFCLALGFAVQAHAEDAQPLAGVTPLSNAVLAEKCGGFITPQGLDISIGIDTQTSINGQLVVHNTLTSQQIAGIPSLSAIPGVNSIVTNTANNAVIKQLNTVNIDVGNFSQVYHPAERNAYMGLQTQMLSLIHTGIR